MNFVNVSTDIMATTKSRVLPVGNNFFVWHLLNSLTEKVYETLRHVFGQHIRNSIIWAFTAKYHVIHWQMQIKSVIGAYMQTLRRRLSALQESFMSTKILVSNCNKPHMHWMPRLLIYVCLYFHGLNFAVTKELSSCTLL